jgi:ABC-type nitrate/sulfonate/bicarbonate transport system substrate-binding protein
MMTITRALASVAIAAGAAVGLACPAAAEALSGTYTATPVPNENGMGVMYPSTTYTFTPCGPDCTRLLIGGEGGQVVDLHLQGNAWTGTWVSENGKISCTESVNSDGAYTSRLCNDKLLAHHLTKA